MRRKPSENVEHLSGGTDKAAGFDLRVKEPEEHSVTRQPIRRDYNEGKDWSGREDWCQRRKGGPAGRPNRMRMSRGISYNSGVVPSSPARRKSSSSESNIPLRLQSFRLLADDAKSLFTVLNENRVNALPTRRLRGFPAGSLLCG